MNDKMSASILAHRGSAMEGLISGSTNSTTTSSSNFRNQNNSRAISPDSTQPSPPNSPPKLQAPYTKDESLLSTCPRMGPPVILKSYLMPFRKRTLHLDNPQPAEKFLGYGAFGVVWAAVDPRTNFRVAIKRIPKVFHNTITAKRVFRELKMLEAINHENIVSLHDILRVRNDGTEIFFLFELMQTDLHKIIASSQALTIDHVKLFVYQILRALKYLHSARIIHRDIKPGNMLVNSNCLLKLCDFGLARVADPYGEVALTHEVVTQYYRSPELLMEAQRYSFSVDIWSVGCTFAELLARRILFQARGPIEQLDMIIALTGTPSPEALDGCHDEAKKFVMTLRPRKADESILYSLSPNVSASCVQLLSAMLKFDPHHRITAVDALHHPYLEDARLRYHSCMCSCCDPANLNQQSAAVMNGEVNNNNNNISNNIGNNSHHSGRSSVAATPDSGSSEASTPSSTTESPINTTAHVSSSNAGTTNSGSIISPASHLHHHHHHHHMHHHHQYDDASHSSSPRFAGHNLVNNNNNNNNTSTSSITGNSHSSNSVSSGGSNRQSTRSNYIARKFCANLDPVSPIEFPISLDRNFTSLGQAKRLLNEAINEYHQMDDRSIGLTLNPRALNYRSLANAKVASSQELPQGHRWR